MMRTIMIVDDEKLVRLGLQSVIDWKKNGYEVIGVYKNGEEAWDAIQMRSPDIVLTDIRMPKMDGITLISLLKQNFPHVNVIILSSHEDYEYTRKAIQLNVKDYLLKHELEPDDLLRVLSSLEFFTDSDEVEPSSILALEKQKLMQLINQPEHEIWQDESLLFTQFPLLAKPFKKKARQDIFWLSFRLVPRKSSDLEHEYRAIEALLEELFHRFDAHFMTNEAGTYAGFIYSSDLPLASAKEQVDEFINEIFHSTKKVLNIALYCGISSCFSQYDSLPGAKIEAEKALEHFFYQGSGVYWHDEWPDTRCFSEAEWIRLYHQAKQLIWNEQFDELYLWIQNQFETVLPVLNTEETMRFVQMIVQRLTDYLLERYQMEFMRQIKDVPTLYDQFSQLQLVSTCEEVLQILIKVLHVGEEVVHELKERKNWIIKTYEYIEANFEQSIRLEDAARQVNFSENYFSQRFHQETGYSFTNYLMRYRIEKAKALLLVDQQSTDEIANQVGYSNPNYFIKVFKKITGMTISEFKRKK